MDRHVRKLNDYQFRIWRTAALVTGPAIPFIVWGYNLLDLGDAMCTRFDWGIFGVTTLLGLLGFLPRINRDFIRKVYIQTFYFLALYSVWLIYDSGLALYFLFTLGILLTISAHIFREKRQLVFFLLMIGITFFGMLLVASSSSVKYRMIIGIAMGNLLMVNYIIGRFNIRSLRIFQKSSQDLANAQKTLRGLIDSTHEAMLIFDRDGIIQGINLSFQQFFKKVRGIEVQQGDRLLDHLKTSPIHEVLKKGFESAFEGKGIRDEVFFSHVDEYYSLIINPVLAQNPIQHIAVYMQDITTEKKQKSSLARIRQAVKSSGEAMVIHDLAGKTQFVNPAFNRLLGIGELHLDSFRLEDWLVGPNTSRKVMNCVKAGWHLQADTDIQNAQGRIIPTKLRIDAILDEEGKKIGSVTLISDVSNLKRTERILQGVMTHSSVGLIALKTIRNPQTNELADFEVSVINPVARGFFTQSVEQTPQTLSTLLPEWRQIPFLPQLPELIKHTVIQQQEFRAQHPGLHDGWYQVSAVEESDTIIVTMSDISERKRTEEQLRNLSLVASKIHGGVLIMDAQANIEWANQAFMDLTGYALEEIKGISPPDLLAGPETSQDDLDKVIRAVQQGHPTQFEILAYRKDGTPYWSGVSFSPIKDEKGRVIKFISIELDVTQRIQAERELKNAKQMAESATQAKAQFLANMSHEIRTPMNAVIGLTGLLLETELNEEQSDYLDTIRKSGENLLTLINDILDFSKIESGNMQLESHQFGLLEIIANIKDLLGPKIVAKELEFIVEYDEDLPAIIHSDSTRLTQILMNLLGNAIKFTEAGYIKLSIKRANKDQNQGLQFCVEDTGIGIPHEKLSTLFTAFTQVDASTTRRFGGTGLGLSISHRLIQLLGGEVYVESELGKGTKFHFTIRPDQMDGPTIRECSARPLPDLNVVVLGADTQGQKTIIDQFHAWRINVLETISDCDELERLMLRKRVDFVFINLQGAKIEICQEMLDALAGRFQGIPKFILGGDLRQRKWIKSISNHYWLQKPFRRNHLLREMAKLGLASEHQTPTFEDRQPTEHVDLELPSHISILVVEDNLVNQKVITRMLGKLDYVPEVAANGLEALDALRMRSFDLIFMDMQMPEMDGLTATRKIRELMPDPSSAPVIIAMTANAMKGDREACLEAGMNDYLSKPIKPAQIKDRMLMWFGKEVSR
ncbi:PAS domain S-box protein [Pontibacter sp. G13]|uniref:PAS domain S-box protein n=1 Tax=Pontibacter sp. G13 TaxID=3074898 RepID=UPI00288B0C45|nr:PAS domain S-box protein [Pontibacter sp. G13]WNJ20873.1 PAS domain S-box protein [Pontibacter sp. G13]